MKNTLSIAINHVAQHAELVSVLNFELPAGQAPEWIELIPSGATVVGRDGRSWLNDPAAVIAAFNAGGRDLVIDTEHSTEIRAPHGDPAPAAGWITALESRSGAVVGRVAWTPAGAAAVANREYRYISPVFTYERQTGRIVQLTSIGLTNRPNLRLAALNHRQSEEDTMLKKLLTALGLAETATEEQVLNAVSTLQGDLQTARNRAQTPDLALFVPRADYDVVLGRAANAEKALADKARTDLDAQIEREVGAAMQAGKITPATKDYYMAMCRQQNGLEEFRKFVAAAPVIGDPSKLDRMAPVTGKALNAEELDVCERLGISEEQYRKTAA
jgi:phage I-like protein